MLVIVVPIWPEGTNTKEFELSRAGRAYGRNIFSDNLDWQCGSTHGV
jgi:hypothetical protein